MARGRPTRRKRRSQDDLHDPVLQSKTAPARRPIAWETDEEGDLSPVSATVHDSTEEQIQRRRDRRRRYREQRREKREVGSQELHRQRQLSRPFPILRLPTELRLIIFRFALLCTHHLTATRYRH